MRGIRRTLLLGASLALLPSVSSADDPYADYRIPEHYWRSWTASIVGTGSFHRGPGTFSGQTKDGRLRGQAVTSFTGGYDSDPRLTSYGLTFIAAGNRQRREWFDENPFGTVYSGTSQDASTSQLIDGFFTHSHYPWGVPLGISLGASVIANFQQLWAWEKSVNELPPAEYHHNSDFTSGGYSVISSIRAAVPWGRVRDATPIYQVQVLEQRLLETGTIQRELSRTARERLASLYTTEKEFAFAHNRPSKYFWRELELLLTDDGVLSERGLDAWAVQRLLEPLTIRGGVARARGFSIGPQVLLSQLQQHTSWANANSTTIFVADTLYSTFESTPPRTEFNEVDNTIFSGLAVDWHQPFGPRWQVDAFSSGLLSESGRVFQLTSGFQGVWLIADRWYAQAILAHDLRAPGSGWDRSPESWNVRYGATLSYFLEDRWTLDLAADQRQLHEPTRYLRDEAISLGVSFRFSGFLNAPGLFEPMRLTPPGR